MSMKPPSGLAAETESEHDDHEHDGEDLSDEIEVDASDDVTVEASEEVTTESVTKTHVDPGETPPPLSSLADSAVGGAGVRPMASTLLGVLGPALPLPGVTAPTPPEERYEERDIGDDVTTLARGGEEVTRPAITDDDEEETKVEPAETAIHAAASRDDVATALSEQASLEREKALRKSVPPLFGSDVSSGDRSDVEFADPEDEDGAAADAAPANDDDDGDQIVSADPIDDDDDGIVVGGHRDPAANHPAAADDDAEDDSTAMFAKSPQPSPLVAALTARRPGSPPTGSPFGRDGYGSARLPTPGPGFAGLSLSTPAQAPAPASSPFGKLQSVPAGTPYGARQTGSIPVPAALHIPAPSGAAAAPTTGGTGLFRRVPMPIGGLVVGGLIILVIGLVAGGALFGGRAPAPAPVVVAHQPAPPSAPVVQPVAPPANAAEPTPIPAAAAAPTPPEPTAAKTAAAPPVAEAVDEAATPPPAAAKPVKHVVKPHKPALPDDGTAPAPAPKAAAAKPAKPAKPASKVAKGWVDPFAQ
jgi:hypothetical protein